MLLFSFGGVSAFPASFHPNRLLLWHATNFCFSFFDIWMAGIKKAHWQNSARPLTFDLCWLLARTCSHRRQAYKVDIICKWAETLSAKSLNLELNCSDGLWHLFLHHWFIAIEGCRANQIACVCHCCVIPLNPIYTDTAQDVVKFAHQQNAKHVVKDELCALDTSVQQLQHSLQDSPAAYRCAGAGLQRSRRKFPWMMHYKMLRHVMCMLHPTPAAAAGFGPPALPPSNHKAASCTWLRGLFCMCKMVHAQKCHRAKRYRRLRHVTYRLPMPAVVAGCGPPALPPSNPKAATSRQLNALSHALFTWVYLAGLAEPV